ncbi:MAG: SDR family oxidoreductase [Chloroflexi bacterium]|nr:SDR family oxidoreductase [Chloroflexota bacterium]
MRSPRQRNEAIVTRICEGRVVIVTGAGRGLGRAHALEFARQGARVVVNDLGAELDGTGSSTGPAGEVVDEIRQMGGEAIANGEDISEWDGAERAIKSAVDTFGDLHAVVNNAGILRDRMLVNMSLQEWDAVIKVHLRGTFCMSQQAAARWREQSKTGTPADGRIINTTSPTGLYGNVGQTNYGAAKAGIAMFTMIAADEVGRYGVTVNCICPSARTRMTETIVRRPSSATRQPEDGFDSADPANVSPLVVWLASSEASDVTGRVFNVRGGRISVAEPWIAGPELTQDARWDPAQLGPVVHDLVSQARGRVDMSGHPRMPAATEAR